MDSEIISRLMAESGRWPPGLRAVVTLMGWIWSPPIARGRVPKRSVVAMALGFEAAIFLWLAVAMPFPWPLSIGLASFVVLATLATYLNPPDEERKGWPRRAKLALWLTLGLDVLLTAFLGLILFLILVDQAMAGRGPGALLVGPVLLIAGFYASVGFVLFLIFTLLVVLATAVLLGTESVLFLAVPLVMAMGIAVILFESISPTPKRDIRVNRRR